VLVRQLDAQIIGDYESFPVFLFRWQARSDEILQGRGGLFDGGDPGLILDGAGCCRKESVDVSWPAMAVIEPVEALEQIAKQGAIIARHGAKRMARPLPGGLVL
jgi:hypothetical protein